MMILLSIIKKTFIEQYNLKKSFKKKKNKITKIGFINLKRNKNFLYHILF